MGQGWPTRYSAGARHGANLLRVEDELRAEKQRAGKLERALSGAGLVLSALPPPAPRDAVDFGDRVRCHHGRLGTTTRKTAEGEPNPVDPANWPDLSALTDGPKTS